MAKALKMFRQGDVLIAELSSLVKIPKEAKEVEKDKDGSVTLAYGEVTGHRHRFDKRHANICFLRNGAEEFLSVDEEGVLTHEEHADIVVPKGKYRVTIQREWNAGMARRVAD